MGEENEGTPQNLCKVYVWMGSNECLLDGSVKHGSKSLVYKMVVKRIASA